MIPNARVCDVCGRAVRWVSTEGRRAFPVDAVPVEDGGSVVWDPGAESGFAVPADGAAVESPAAVRLVDHAETCPGVPG